MSTHTFYTIDSKYPYRKIKEAHMSVKVCKKTSWACGYDKNYLIGATAFYTLKSAERSKFGHLERRMLQMRNSNYAMWHHPHVYEAMRKEYMKYKDNGTFVV